MTALENLAFKLLTAIREESKREPSPLKCRFMADLAQPLMSQDEFTQAQAYIFKNSLVDAWKREGRYVATLNLRGTAFLESNIPKPGKWTLDNRLKIIAIIISLLGLLAVVVFHYFS